MSYPRFQRARHFKFVTENNGGANRTLTGTTTWTVYPGTGFNALTLLAEAGDVIEAGMSARVSNQAVALAWDVHTVVSGTPTNSFGSQGAVSASDLGVGAWLCDSGQFDKPGPPVHYRLVSGDIVSGVATFGLYYRMDALVDKSVFLTSGRRIHFYVKNLGPTAEYPV